MRSGGGGACQRRIEGISATTPCYPDSPRETTSLFYPLIPVFNIEYTRNHLPLMRQSVELTVRRAEVEAVDTPLSAVHV